MELKDILHFYLGCYVLDKEGMEHMVRGVDVDGRICIRVNWRYNWVGIGGYRLLLRRFEDEGVYSVGEVIDMLRGYCDLFGLIDRGLAVDYDIWVRDKGFKIY